MLVVAAVCVYIGVDQFFAFGFIVKPVVNISGSTH